MDSLIQSLGKEGKVDLPLLQIVGDNIYQTVHSRDEKAITLKDVEVLGHVEDILGDFLQEKLEELRDKMEMGKDILKSLLTSHATKKIASLEYITENVRLAGEGSNNTEVSTFLQKFERSRLIRRMEDGSYELTHDYLAKRINAWISEKDREVRKIEEMVDLAFRDFKERALYLDAERLRVSTPFKHTISMVKEQREFLSLSEKTRGERDKSTAIGRMISNPDYPIVFSFHGHSSLVHSVSWSPDGERLASGSRDKTIKIWKMKYQESTLQEELMRSERAYNLKLNGLNLEPVRPESKNLNKNKTSPPAWPRTHPFHWLESAKNGDSDAMIQLGIIYDRDNRNDKALKWYQKAADAENDYGKERLEFLKKWIEDRGN